MNFSLKTSVGTIASYCPRVTACMKPSHVRGYPQFIGGFCSDAKGRYM